LSFRSSDQQGFNVVKSGILSLIQDRGRFGQHSIGLTTGGPLDPIAFRAANRLCGNDDYDVAIEVSVGGLALEAQLNCTIAVAGAPMPLKINGDVKPLWRSQSIQKGDLIELGYAQMACRSYMAVTGGFRIQPMFSSCATVVREGVGGLDGEALKQGDVLPCRESTTEQHFYWAEKDRPIYSKVLTLRVVMGYQRDSFRSGQVERFFNSEYTVSQQCDRMGYRLEGPAVTAVNDGVLSEGISYGAIQFPADGQPIILMNDRQTIGGYPKLGTLLSTDLGMLAQLTAGCKVRFQPITIAQAQRLVQVSERRFNRLRLQRC
jgi:biotin-dependent carboxylase-like uncharacterized protein